MKIPYGYCHCGCGQKTRISERTHRRHGHFKGQPLKFINHHNVRVGEKGKSSKSWKGGKIKNCNNRTMIHQPDHPRAKGNAGYVFQSILMAEKVLGKRLPEGTIVHHANGDQANDKNNNLVICQDQGYHQLLHQRMRAYYTCGNASWLKCKFCKKYDDPINLRFDKNGRNQHHQECNKAYCKNRYYKYCRKELAEKAVAA